MTNTAIINLNITTVAIKKQWLINQKAIRLLINNGHYFTCYIDQLPKQNQGKHHLPVITVESLCGRDLPGFKVINGICHDEKQN